MIDRADPIRFGRLAKARARLFCFPYAGVGASAYRLWGKSLPDFDVIALQMPGREGRLAEPPFESIEAMVSVALPVIRAHADLPFAIFGHSMGALVAFEVALALEAAGDAVPIHLFVSARRPADAPERDTLLNQLPDAELLAALEQRYGGVPTAILQEEELLRLLLPTMRADLKAIESYAPRADRQVRCRITVYGGANDRRPYPTELPGWQRMSEHPTRVRVFDGDHFYLASQRDALLTDVAATIDTELAQRASRDGTGAYEGALNER